MKEMYKGKPFSPPTTLAQPINELITEVKVIDISVFPPAPNLATIGADEYAETILYTLIVGNTLQGCTRGIQGDAKAWLADEVVSRNFTALDYDTLVDNVLELKEEISAVTSRKSFGNIGGSDDYQFDVFANVTGTRYPNGLWEISFFGKIDANTAPNDFNNFNQGLSIAKLKMLLGIEKNLEYQYVCKNAKIYDNNMQIITRFSTDEECLQYGYALEEVHEKYFVFARYYTSTGLIGGWPSAIQDLYKVGNFLEANFYMQEVE